ncbi:MAG: glycine-rich domain-containing protein [Pseudomonadota bacterium]
MMFTPALIVSLGLGVVFLFSWKKWRAASRAEFIRTYPLPRGLFDKLHARHPHLTAKEYQLVARALRHFFLAHLKSGCKFVSMPSQVVDDLWHELILHTKEYSMFCNKAFGRFMHHTPATAMSSAKQSNAGLRRCWWYTCLEENINPKNATRLPLLFALDAKLNIPNGFRYTLDCSKMKSGGGDGSNTSVVHCGSDFSNSSFDGTTDGFGGESSGGGADGSGCGGGCGGGD